MIVSYTENELQELKKFLIKAANLKPPYNQEAYVAFKLNYCRCVYTWSELIETITKEILYRNRHEYIIHTFCQHVPFEHIPFYINNSIISPYAKWRLKIGK